LAEFTGIEFTGERVIPGLVDADLLNEHLARYRFAAQFGAEMGPGATVLDAGCGTGYGTEEFGQALRVVGVDVAAEAVAHAARTFSRPGVHFVQGSCDSLPFADSSFDLVAAFEVIEHLERWEEMLTEARRVLKPPGVLLVSTPNKAYYAEARGDAGPNPYHVREFEYGEFAAALHVVFPHVNLWSQNHSEAIAFIPSGAFSAGDLDAPRDAVPQHAHFFLAACSRSPMPETRAFAWLPSSGNVLRERERHIALLKTEVAQKTAWLKQAQEDHAALQASHEELLGELKATHAGYQERIQQLEAEAAVRLDWVHDLEAQIGRGRNEIARLELESAERTRWAQSLDAELQRTNASLTQSEAQLHMAARSKWVRLGRLLHLGPAIVTDHGHPE
jgi:ubiquinone/menaquinone biosynthesis C-methylase UbiE